MKKLLICIFSLMWIFILAGCGNQSLGIGNFNFDKVHIFSDTGDKCVELERWYDNDLGVEVKCKNGVSLYLSEGRYMLVSGKCPICNKD